MKKGKKKSSIEERKSQTKNLHACFWNLGLKEKGKYSTFSYSELAINLLQMNLSIL